MDIKVTRIEFQDDRQRIVATVAYSEKDGLEFQSADVRVFLDLIDSYAEIKRQAIEKAQAFLSHVASAH